ncbi:MAG: TPM domain-containing protein [Solobacterium sp.]|nr:TPM domain-containing protein [Solobacterium sp.]
MKKVLLPAVISLMMSTLAVPVFAQGDEFILDYDGYLTAAQKAELNEEAQEILRETGYSVLLLLDETNTGSLVDYAVSEYNAHAPSADGIILAVDSDESMYTVRETLPSTSMMPSLNGSGTRSCRMKISMSALMNTWTMQKICLNSTGSLQDRQRLPLNG